MSRMNQKHGMVKNIFPKQMTGKCGSSKEGTQIFQMHSHFGIWDSRNEFQNLWYKV
jgi:hypothetical protein